MLKFFFSLCLSVGVAIGGQSIVFTPGNGINVTDPNLATTSNHTLEFQMNSWSTPGSEVNVVGLNGIGIGVNLEPDGSLRITDVRDSLQSGGVCGIPLAGYTNVLVRVMRSFTNLTFSCEVWNYDGSNYQAQVIPIATVNSWVFTNGGAGNGCTCNLGFLREIIGTQAINGTPPTTFTNLSNPNLWSEWKYDGNLNDSGPNNHTQTVFVGSATYGTTPNQVAISLPKTGVTTPWSNSIPMRAGQPNILDGTSSYNLADGTATVTCFWNELSGPTAVTWSSHTSCAPTINGVVFGEYVFVLTASGSSSNNLTVGAVATDSNHVVVYPDSRLYSVLGPTIAWGYNPWSYVDYSQKHLSEYWGSQFAINGGTWDYEVDAATVGGVPRTGTAFVAAGSNTVNGIGTNFADVYCGGNTTPGTPVVSTPIGSYININVPQTGTAPLSYYRQLDHCNGQTQVVMAAGYTWETQPTVASPGYSWGSVGVCTACGNWSNANNTGSNLNYYDGQGLGNYVYYYRSGLSAPHKTAQWVADHWYRNQFPSSPRDFDYVSAYVRATVDSTNNPPTYNALPWLRDHLDNSIGCTIQSSTANQISDAREAGSCLMYRGVEALLDPDSTTVTNAKTFLANSLTGTWQAQQQANGSFVQNVPGGDTGHTWQMTTGSTTATLVNGPAVTSAYCGQSKAHVDNVGTVSIGSDRLTVTGTGVNFTTAGVVVGDIFSGTVTYLGHPTSFQSTVASVNSSTSLTLAYNWRGTVSTNLSFYRIYDATTGGILGGNFSQYFVWATVANQFFSPYTQDNDNFYICSVGAGGTSLTLDKPYTGSTATTPYRFVQTTDFDGPGVQPYMMSFVTWGQKMASDALAVSNPTGSTGYVTSLTSATDFLYNFAHMPIHGGMLPAYGFTNCVNPDDSLWIIYPCSGGTLSQNQDYAVETFNAFASAYAKTGNTTYKTEGDLLYNAAFGAPGYTVPGGFSTNVNFADLLNCCDVFTLTKYYGQTFSLGAAARWPAERIGGVLPTQNRTVGISFRLADAPTSTKVSITVYYPNGNTTTTVCATSPCAVTVDDRQGTALYTMQYQTAGNVPLATTPAPMQLK